MGAVDLVIQVESPKSVTRGLQRVGRAGHNLGDVSKGRIFPKFRADLLECAVVARRMREGLIEETVIPRNPLDVLAQHIVSMVADEEWTVDEIFEVVTATEPFSDLGREQLENVLDMLDGRYPSERFAELRPRIVWERSAGTVRGRKGARQLAVTNAGTIPDRGLYGVHLPDGRRVGELDEEMVYEARAGQTFLLGATTWRIEEITRDRVIVTPAPGVPGAVPFWRGDGIGRPAELGRAIGEFAREAVNSDAKTLAKDYDLDKLAAENLLTYLKEQQAATRVIPSDESIVVEKFRDEIGDWRLCVLSPFGGRVHAAWGLALSAKIRNELDLEADAIWSDDGIVVHLPDADEAPDGGPRPARARRGRGPGRLRAGRLGALRRALPRERGALAPPAARLPRQAHAALAAAPQVAEPARGGEGLPALPGDPRDLPRVPARRARPAGARVAPLRPRLRRISLVEVETASASPFASSLLFDYVATYMYEGDTPNAERRAAALALDRDLLRELLGQEELRELIDPEALESVEASLQHLNDEIKARDRDALQQILRRLGDLTEEECQERVGEALSAASMLGKLEDERRAAKVRVNGEERWIAAEDAGLYRDALGVPPPPGLPESFGEEVPDAMSSLVRRWARTHGPFPTRRLADRYGIDPMPALRELEREGILVRGELLPGGTEREWCDSEVLRRVRRASLAQLRQEVEAVDPAELARFLPSWQNVDAHRPAGAGPDRLREALVPMQGVALTPEVWERDVLPRRLGAYNPAWLDQLTTSGEVVWIGAGSVARSGRVALYFRDDVRLAGPPPSNAKLEVPAGRDPRPDPRAAGRVARVLDRPRRRARGEPRGAPGGAVGSGLGGRGDQRRLRAAARPAPQRGQVRGAPRPALLVAANRHHRHGAGPLVAHLLALPRPARAGPADARAGRAPARALRHRHPRDGPGRGHPRRPLDPLRRALEPGDAGHRSPRLLRRGPGRRAVRARRRGRAPPEPAAGRRRVPRPRRDRSGQPVRRLALVAEAARGPAPGADRRRLPPHPERQPAALRRARRPRDPAPSGGRGPGAGRCRRPARRGLARRTSSRSSRSSGWTASP